MKILISWMILGKKSKVNLVKVFVKKFAYILNLNENLNKLINFDLFVKTPKILILFLNLRVKISIN